jgi:hypothetical protein
MAEGMRRVHPRCQASVRVNENYRAIFGKSCGSFQLLAHGVREASAHEQI